MKVGIVGMPNAGKSSLFNALTRAGAEAANYPFTTIEPNIAIVPVADERLDEVSAVIGASDVVADTISFHDIAGLVKGASEGEGLGNQFLGNIRETDAIVHVVRAHNDPNILHSEGSVDPARDIETIETELVYADLEQVEKRLERVVRTARGGDRPAIAEQRWLEDVRGELQAGRPARGIPMPEEVEKSQSVHLITAKPVLFVANVDEGSDEVPPEVAAHERWWDACWRAQEARGREAMTLTPEFGNEGYLHHLPWTDVPVANLWDICNWQAKRQAERATAAKAH